MDDYSALFILSYFFSAPLIQVTKACFDFVAHLAKGLLNSVLLAILNTNVNETIDYNCHILWPTICNFLPEHSFHYLSRLS